MIYGIGTDIVKVQRMQHALDRFGHRFAQKILTDFEMAGFVATAKPAHFLSKRFAAKEALVKAMGTGFRDGITLKDIHIENNDRGQPRLEFSPSLKQTHAAMGIGDAFLSLADEEDYALAFVTLLRAALH